MTRADCLLRCYCGLRMGSSLAMRCLLALEERIFSSYSPLLAYLAVRMVLLQDLGIHLLQNMLLCASRGHQTKLPLQHLCTWDCGHSRHAFVEWFVRKGWSLADWPCDGKANKARQKTWTWNSGVDLMEKKMETTIVYWGFIGIMEKKMEAT